MECIKSTFVHIRFWHIYLMLQVYWTCSTTYVKFTSSTQRLHIILEHSVNMTWFYLNTCNLVEMRLGQVCPLTQRICRIYGTHNIRRLLGTWRAHVKKSGFFVVDNLDLWLLSSKQIPQLNLCINSWLILETMIWYHSLFLCFS